MLPAVGASSWLAKAEELARATVLRSLPMANVRPARGDTVFQTTAFLIAGALTPGRTSGTTGCAVTVIASTELVARSNRSDPLRVSRSSDSVSPTYNDVYSARLTWWYGRIGMASVVPAALSCTLRK